MRRRIKISFLMMFRLIIFSSSLLTDGIWNYKAMSKVPLCHLIISIFLSSQIIVQLPFSIIFFRFRRKSCLFRFRSGFCRKWCGVFRPKTKSNFRSASNLKWFLHGAPGDQRPNFDGFICIHYAAPPYSARISGIYLFPFGNLVQFHLLTSVCNAWQRSRTQNLQRVSENSGPI